MPQRTFSESDFADTPKRTFEESDFAPVVSSGQRGMPPRAGLEKQPINYDMPTPSSILPSMRTVARTGGAFAGGVIGASGGPAGAIAGGALGGGLGDAAYQAVQAYRTAPDAPSTIGQAAAGVGAGMAGGALQEAVGALIPRIGSAAASRLYRISLKPSTTLTNEEAADVANTLLKSRIPISESGSRKLQTLIEDLGQKVEGEIAQNPTAPISPGTVASKVSPVVRNLTYKDLQSDAAAAANEQARFMSEHSIPGRAAVPPQPTGILDQYGNAVMSQGSPAIPPRQIPIEAARAQAMKKAIYQEVYPLNTPSGYGLARQAEGRGLKEGLEQLFPNIQGLNAQQGQLLEAQPQLTRAVNRTANRDVLGLGSPIASAAVSALTGKPALGIGAALAKNAGSRTAILIDALAPKLVPTKYGLIPLGQFLTSDDQSPDQK